MVVIWCMKWRIIGKRRVTSLLYFGKCLNSSSCHLNVDLSTLLKERVMARLKFDAHNVDLENMFIMDWFSSVTPRSFFVHHLTKEIIKSGHGIYQWQGNVALLSSFPYYNYKTIFLNNVLCYPDIEHWPSQIVQCYDTHKSM